MCTTTKLRDVGRLVSNNKRLAMAIVFAGALPAGAAAQQCSGRGSPGFGIECENCSIVVGDGESVWRFSTEPRIRGVDPDAPAADAVRAGDMIVSIDGYLITTASGGARLSTLSPGEPVTLIVRRNGELIRTRFDAVAQPCAVARGRMSYSPHRPAAQQGSQQSQNAQAREQNQNAQAREQNRSAQAREQNRSAQAREQNRNAQARQQNWEAREQNRSSRDVQRIRKGASAGENSVYYLDDVVATYTPGAAFGFAIACSDCTQTYVNGRDTTAVIAWKFDQQPELYSVEPGSAADRAGMRRGDVITHVDGIAITRPEAGRRFGTVRPGEPVRFTYRRGNSTRAATVTAQQANASGRNTYAASVAPGHASVAAATGPVVALGGNLHVAGTANVKGAVQPIRFSGRLGDTDVEVRGGVGVIVNYTDDEIVIISGDTTIRLRRR